MAAAAGIGMSNEILAIGAARIFGIGFDLDVETRKAQGPTNQKQKRAEISGAMEVINGERSGRRSGESMPQA